jgi:hypothetical protein
MEKSWEENGDEVKDTMTESRCCIGSPWSLPPVDLATSGFFAANGGVPNVTREERIQKDLWPLKV